MDVIILQEKRDQFMTSKRIRKIPSKRLMVFWTSTFENSKYLTFNLHEKNKKNKIKTLSLPI